MVFNKLFWLVLGSVFLHVISTLSYIGNYATVDKQLCLLAYTSFTQTQSKTFKSIIDITQGNLIILSCLSSLTYPQTYWIAIQQGTVQCSTSLISSQTSIYSLATPNYDLCFYPVGKSQFKVVIPTTQYTQIDNITCQQKINQIQNNVVNYLFRPISSNGYNVGTCYQLNNTDSSYFKMSVFSTNLNCITIFVSFANNTLQLKDKTSEFCFEYYLQNQGIQNTFYDQFNTVNISLCQPIVLGLQQQYPGKYFLFQGNYLPYTITSCKQSAQNSSIYKVEMQYNGYKCITFIQITSQNNYSLYNQDADTCFIVNKQTNIKSILVLLVIATFIA